jgi:hypothetical protein
MTPAQLQEICIEAEDLRHRVQTAYRKHELTDEDAKDLLRMLRDIGLFITSPSSNTTGKPSQ